MRQRTDKRCVRTLPREVWKQYLRRRTAEDYHEPGTLAEEKQQNSNLITTLIAKVDALEQRVAYLERHRR